MTSRPTTGRAYLLGDWFRVALEGMNQVYPITSWVEKEEVRNVKECIPF